MKPLLTYPLRDGIRQARKLHIVSADAAHVVLLPSDAMLPCQRRLFLLPFGRPPSVDPRIAGKFPSMRGPSPFGSHKSDRGETKRGPRPPRAGAVTSRPQRKAVWHPA